MISIEAGGEISRPCVGFSDGIKLRSKSVQEFSAFRATLLIKFTAESGDLFRPFRTFRTSNSGAARSAIIFRSCRNNPGRCVRGSCLFGLAGYAAFLQVPTNLPPNSCSANSPICLSSDHPLSHSGSIGRGPPPRPVNVHNWRFLNEWIHVRAGRLLLVVEHPAVEAVAALNRGREGTGVRHRPELEDRPAGRERERVCIIGSDQKYSFLIWSNRLFGRSAFSHDRITPAAVLVVWSACSFSFSGRKLMPSLKPSRILRSGYGRFRTEADMDRQATSAKSVESDLGCVKTRKAETRRE